MEQLFEMPLNHEDAINERTAVFEFLKKCSTVFEFNTIQFDTIDTYLANTDERSKLQYETKSLEQKLKTFITSDTQRQEALKGIDALIAIGRQSFQYIGAMRQQSVPSLLKRILQDMEELLSTPIWLAVLNRKTGSKISYDEAVSLDHLFRFSCRGEIIKLLEKLYQLDVFYTVSKIARERNWVFATACPASSSKLIIENLRHPQLSNATPNSIKLEKPENVIFLTGANMAGKSTLMKSIGIALYLAHMGFPLSVQSMEFSVKEGLLTTINLADNIGMGYSHFYAEVKRIKKMVELAQHNRAFFFIVDELFRGTNVKDAEEATIVVTGGFARKMNTMLMVSTHIMEAGTVLKENHDSIQFLFLPTTMVDGKPQSNYKLERGITADRHGMLIIKNEGILEILKSKQ